MNPTQPKHLPSFVRAAFDRDAILLWLPVGIVVLVGAIFTIHANMTLRKDHDLLVHSHRVIEAGDDLLSGLADSETGQRGYVITGEKRYLEPFVGGQAKAADAVERLSALISANDVQNARVIHVRALMGAKSSELTEVINVRNTAGFGPARDLVAADRGKLIMDELRQTLRALDETEAAILKGKEAEVQRDQIAVFVTGALVALVSVLVRAIVAVADSRRRGRSAAARQSG